MNRSAAGRFPRVLGVWSIACAVLLLATEQTAHAAGVVGMGTATSCTDAALNDALAGGGLVTFNCGGGPLTITVTSTKSISADTTIDGGSQVTISGGDSVRVFAVNTGVNFTVQNLTIAAGSAAGGGSTGGQGGGIYNGGGMLTVTNSTFSRNSAGGTAGGGISNDKRGTLTVTNSTFSGNSAHSGGGAIFTGNGTLTVSNSTFTGNSAGLGGGIGNTTGTVTVSNSTFSGNGAGGGGGIFNEIGTVTVTNSTFAGNSAQAGGGIDNEQGAALSVTNSTFTGNSAIGGDFNYGGGIYNGGPLTVSNSTLTGNRAALGGGIYTTPGSSDEPLIVTNSTFSGNTATGQGEGEPPGGGAIYCAGSAPCRATNTIVANSTSGGNCSGHLFTDGGHNLDDGTSCGFSTLNGSLNNTNPQLDPAGLKDNGGPTQTIALQPGSPATDAGDDSACAAAPVNNRDQRDFVRPGTGHRHCSIGAYEADAVAGCTGDCSGTHTVAVNDLITLGSMALGTAQSSACAYGVPSGAGVNVNLVIQAVGNALNGCSGAPSTPTLTATPTVTRTDTSTPMPTPTSTPTGPTPTPTRTATVTTGTPTPTINATLTPSHGDLVDNGDGTITDTRTGLIWEKKDQSGGLHDMNAQYVWAGICADNATPTVPPSLSKNQASASDSGPCQPDAAAATTCTAATSAVGCAQCVGSQTCGDARGFTTIWEWLEQLNSAHFAGRSDWRIPTGEELKTILDGSASGCISGAPCVSPAFHTACAPGCSVASCSCTQAWNYWSVAPEDSFSGRDVWAVNFKFGSWSYGGKGDAMYVRAVRGTAIPTPTATPTDTPLHASFVDNGDGTITDTQRGLMWEKKDASGGLHDENTLYAWACLTPDAEFFCQPDAAAAATCSAATGGADGCGQCPRGVPCNPEGFTTIWAWLNQLNAAHFAGYSDWRIPTVGDEGGAAELETIVDAGAPRCVDPSRSAACVAAQFDTACMPGCSVASCSCANGDTWSSISVPASPFAWEVVFKGGLLYAENKDSNRFVRAVRGALSPAATATPIPTPIPGKVVDNGDGTITDTQRGLTWEKKESTYLGVGSTYGDLGSHDARARYVWAGLCSDNCGYCQPDAAAAATCSAATGGAVGCALCGGLAVCNAGGGYTLWQWLNDVNAASFAGHSDWRIPTVAQLETIVDAGAPGCGSGAPCAPTAFESGDCQADCSLDSCTPAGLSWSLSPVAGRATEAWLVNFGTGGVDFLDKTLNYYVRAVRGG